MNQKVLVSVHGYAGDRHQIEMLMPVYRHHGFPVAIASPEDSKIEPITPWQHYSIFEGKRAYIGQDSWTRQHLQMKRLLDFDFDWILMHDSDSFCFSPPLPDYLFEDQNAFYSNQVNDFRIPGQTWTDKSGSVTWADDYHAGFPLIAMQPSYFCSRSALEKLVAADDGLIADPITPFIDWYMVVLAVKAGLNYQAFRDCVSCETETELGLRLVSERVAAGAIFIHAVKRQHAFDTLAEIYRSTLK